jgi:hypothetical protein
MKSILIKGLVSLFALALTLQSFAQDPEAALAAFNKKLPAEKIYIHYDRDHYNAGETIWFKAYVYSNGLPATESHNIYLQLVNSAGQVIDKKLYPVAGATANGSISLPDSLPAGSYYIRATTPTMLNLGEEFVYRKNIPVYAPGKMTADGKIERRPYTVQFFPEGGNFVDGIITITAIKSRDKWGYPVPVSGVIKSNTGTVMASFKTASDGFGRVQLKTVAGQTYTAEVETDGKKYTYPLPAVQPGGVNIRITDEKDGKVFQLTRGEAQRDKYQSVTLLVQLNNEVVYRNMIPFDDYLSVKGRLLTQALPSGILHFTVFDASGNPIAERLSFVNNKDYSLTPELVVEGTSFDGRGQNQLLLKIPEGVKGVFSVSVTDASTPTLPDRENIYSRLFLSGDLKEHVFNGASYFERTDDSTKKALDNLLLTQSWSRFNWNQLLKNEIPPARYKDSYLRSMSGVVTDEKTGDRIYGGTLNLFLEGGDSASSNYNLPVNNTGKFVLDSLLFFGEGRVMYTYTEGKKPPKVNIVLDRTKMDSIAAIVPKTWADIRMITPGRDMVMNSWNAKAYEPKPVAVTVEVVQKPEEVKKDEPVAPKHAKDAANDKYASGVWKSAGRVVYEETMKASQTTNVLDYILQSIANVKMQGGRLVNSKNFSLGTGKNWDVGVFIDENPVSLGQLQSIQMRDVGMIKFYEAGFVGVGTMYPGGGVVIYKKADDAAKKMANKELPSVPYTGYSLYTDFSKSPDAGPKGTMQDNRKLLYWNPSVYTDGTNNSFTINFRNNDKAKKFKVVVEGFDASGKLLHFEKIIE